MFHVFYHKKLFVGGLLFYMLLYLGGKTLERKHIELIEPKAKDASFSSC